MSEARTPDDLGRAAATARQHLYERMARYLNAVSSRDDLIRSAHKAGINKAQIAGRMGIARTTVDRVIRATRS